MTYASTSDDITTHDTECLTAYPSPDDDGTSGHGLTPAQLGDLRVWLSDYWFGFDREDPDRLLDPAQVSDQQILDLADVMFEDNVAAHGSPPQRRQIVDLSDDAFEDGTGW
jgi:hypothetical protein